MFEIRIHGAKNKTTEVMKLTEINEYYEPGSNYTFVVTGDAVGNPEHVEVTWNYQVSVVNPLTWRLSRPKAYLDMVTIKCLEFHSEWVKFFVNYIIQQLNLLIRLLTLLSIKWIILLSNYLWTSYILIYFIYFSIQN